MGYSCSDPSHRLGLSSGVGAEASGGGGGEPVGFSEIWPPAALLSRLRSLAADGEGRAADSRQASLRGALRSSPVSMCVLAWQALTYCFDCYRPAMKGLIVRAWS